MKPDQVYFIMQTECAVRVSQVVLYAFRTGLLQYWPIREIFYRKRVLSVFFASNSVRRVVVERIFSIKYLSTRLVDQNKYPEDNGYTTVCMYSVRKYLHVCGKIGVQCGFSITIIYVKNIVFAGQRIAYENIKRTVQSVQYVDTPMQMNF